MLSSFSKKNIVLSTAVVISLGLTGCGGGGGSSSGTTTPTKTGVFADAPVEGLSYKTATQSGFTDAQGHFKYKDGETVEFKLGTLLLGKGKAGAFVTPYTISDNNNTIATNIAMVLQNFDANRSNTQVLNLSKLKDFNFSAHDITRDINISATPSALQSQLYDSLTTGSFPSKLDDTNLTLITETKVKAHMDDYIHQYKNSNITKATADNITKATSEYAEGNIVPFTETATNKSQDGTIDTEKLGATGNLKATKILQGTYSGVELKLKDGISSMNIVKATSTEIVEGYNTFLGNFSGKMISDYKAGTEQLVFSSSKFGNADCVNTYKSIMPYQITQENSDLSDLYFDTTNIISTTCPDWINNDSPDEGPEKMKHIVEEELQRDLKDILAKIVT